jgi:hypothetical protein
LTRAECASSSPSSRGETRRSAARARDELADLVLELEDDPLGQLAADAGNRAQAGGLSRLDDPGDSLRARRPERIGEGDLGPTPETESSDSNSSFSAGRCRTVEQDRVVTHERVDLQHGGTRRRRGAS